MRALYILLFTPLMAACSSDNSSAPDAADESNMQLDAAAEANATYPAFTLDAPQVAPQGGPVLATPKVQPVFFPGFDFPTPMTTFMSKVGASTFWSVLSEYKVGALTSATPIALTSAQIVPADIGNINDAYIQSWLQARFDGCIRVRNDAGREHDLRALLPTSTVISLGSFGGGGDGGVPMADSAARRAATASAGTTARSPSTPSRCHTPSCPSAPRSAT